MRNFIKFKRWSWLGLIFLVLTLGKSALAQEVILNDLDGKSVNVASYIGKPVILFFWTTWCPYCRQELKILNQQYAAMDKDGIIVLGVNVSEPDEKVRRFFTGYLLNFKILLDKSGLLADKYDLLGVPTYVFLDKAGQVVSRSHSLPENYKSLLFS